MKSGGKSTQTTATQLDPDTRELNALAVARERALQPLYNFALDSLLRPSFASPFGLMMATPEEAKGATILTDLADMTKLEDAAKSQFERLVMPMLGNRLTASGFGRSGALAEATSDAGLKMMLPLLEMGRSAQGGLANLLFSLSNRRTAPATGLLGRLPNFTPAPTQTVTSRQPSAGFNPFDVLLPVGGAIFGAPFGASGSTLVQRGLSGIFGGA